MSDRELLELAAKAAGIRWLTETTEAGKRAADRFGLWLEIDGEPYEGQRRRFNPLIDDGDAFRLAVKLRIGILHRSSGIEAHAFRSRLIICNEECAEGLDYNAATRRAIVRAAAEIGRVE